MQLQLIEKQNLTPQADKTVWCVTFQYSEPTEYAPGDWLTLKANNRAEFVSEILQKLGLSGDESIELRRIGKVSVTEALTEHLELSVVNPAILNKLQRQYPDKLAGMHWLDRQAMMEYAYGRDILDLLEQFPKLTELKLNFLKVLMPLAPRYYSIASSQKEMANQVRLLIRQVQYQSHNRVHYGVTSTAIAHMNIGDTLPGNLIANRNFKLPDDPHTPIIMIAAGVGLAPFIGFMVERAAQHQTGVTTGPNWLFFGETHQQTTFLCQDKLQQWQASGLLKLTTAFSRDQADKIYVQHRLLENKRPIYQWIQQGAQLYVCGSKEKLAPAVENALSQILQQEAGITAEDAIATLQKMKQQKQLQLDVY